MVDLGEHVLQAVAKLVEERFDFAKGHQRRTIADRRRAVADQVSDRQLKAFVATTSGDADIHPGAAPFVFRSRIGIQIKRRQGFAAGVFDSKETDIGMPDRRLAIGGADAHMEQRLGHSKQAVEHAGQRKIGTQLFIAEAETSFAEPFCKVGDIPVAQFFRQAVLSGEVAQLLEFFAGRGARSLQQLLQESVHGVDALRHLGIDTQLRPRSKTKQLRLAPTQLQDSQDARRIVQLAA